MQVLLNLADIASFWCFFLFWFGRVLDLHLFTELSIDGTENIKDIEEVEDDDNNLVIEDINDIDDTDDINEIADTDDIVDPDDHNDNDDIDDFTNIKHLGCWRYSQF